MSMTSRCYEAAAAVAVAFTTLLLPSTIPTHASRVKAKNILPSSDAYQVMLDGNVSAGVLICPFYRG